VAPDLPLSGGVAYAYARATSPQISPALDFFPRHRVDAWVSYRHRATAGVFARVRYLGDQTSPGTILPAYATLDAAAWIRVDNVRITIRGDNLSGTDYLARPNVHGYGRTVAIGLEALWQ